MFNNIGSKIKALAQVVCWIGIIISIVVGLILIGLDDDTAFIGIIVIVLGSLSSWIGSFMTYGFGQLIENTDKLVEQSEKNVLAPKINISNSSYSEKIALLNRWKDEGLITEEDYNKKMESINK